MNYYTGIGSRSTPDHICELLSELAFELSLDWTLRSGHAPGADQAFERGCEGKAEIYLPWPTFQVETIVKGRVIPRPSDEAFKLAATVHPTWDWLNPAARKFHARNCHQVLGLDLKTPSKFVLCWTPYGVQKGGTAQALRLATMNDIPITNLGTKDGENKAIEWLKELRL